MEYPKICTSAEALGHSPHENISHMLKACFPIHETLRKTLDSHFTYNWHVTRTLLTS